MTNKNRRKLLAYTPMTEREKEAHMKQLIKDLHSGKKGKYRTPGTSGGTGSGYGNWRKTFGVKGV